MTEASLSTPWYKQFWPWFLLMPLAMTVILSSYMLVTAFSKADSVVNSNYYKEGLAINSVIDDLAAARAHALTGALSVEGGRVVLTLTANTELPRQSVRLQFSHPADSRLDVMLDLQAAGNGLYVGKLPSLRAGKWYVDLAGSFVKDGEMTPFRLKTTVFMPAEKIVFGS